MKGMSISTNCPFFFFGILANINLHIALILVGGFGTRLRPLVCTPRADDHIRNRPTCDPLLITLVE